MEIKDEIKNPVKIVNKFIASSFGRGWIGNCDTGWVGDIQMGYFHGISGDRLTYVGKKKFLRINQKLDEISKFFKIAGRLGNWNIADGSVIAVLPEFKSEAVKYCRLYENFFKKEAKIIITDKSHLFEYKDIFGFKEYSPSEEENELTKNEGLVKRLIKTKAIGIESAIKSLSMTESGLLTTNGYQNKKDKEREYTEIIKFYPQETKIFLIEDLGEKIPYLKISEKENPESVKKYFERFGAPIENVADLEIFYETLLEIKD